MSSSKNVLIWLPLPPHAGWRGEGIAQTIENILTNFSDRIQIQLLVSNSHYADVKAAFSDRPNVVVHALTLRGLFFDVKTGGRRKRVAGEVDALLFAKAALVKNGRLLRMIKTASTLAANIKYGFSLALYTWLQQHGLIFRGVDMVWSPTPAIAFSDKLTGERIVSFWDPFVFEYREFEAVAPYLLIKFLKLFKGAKLVFTQSDANRSFLTRVMKLNDSQVAVINNGAPDYSAFVSQEIKSERIQYDGALPVQFRRDILDLWLGSSLSNPDGKILESFVNEAILYRLSMRVREHSKILMVSTQSRPYKGMDTMLALFDGLLKAHPEHDFLFILTCSVPERLRQKYGWFVDRVFEVTRVPNRLHAHLYVMSDLVLHPSFAEGGLGAYPQYEAASLGVPAVINHGRHADELVNQFPQLGQLVSDFGNVEHTVGLIEEILSNANLRTGNIAATQSSRLSWSDVAQRYEEKLISL